MANPGERVTDVALTEDRLIVDLVDGRSILVPLAWFPRLPYATSQERGNWEIMGTGYGLQWSDVDGRFSVEGLLRVAPAPQAKTLASCQRHAPEPPRQGSLLRQARLTAR